MGNLLNTNFVHNVLNLLIAVVGGLEAFLLASGCTTTLTGQIECSRSWLPQFVTPAFIAVVLMLLGMVKTVMNLVRDGLPGLFKVQPPVASANVQTNQPVNVEAGTTKTVKTETVVTGGKKN